MLVRVELLHRYEAVTLTDRKDQLDEHTDLGTPSVPGYLLAGTKAGT